MSQTKTCTQQVNNMTTHNLCKNYKSMQKAKNLCKNTIEKVVDESLAKGWKMSKEIGSASFFTSVIYDSRIAYDRKSLWRLTEEGFFLDEEVGKLALNILLKL